MEKIAGWTNFEGVEKEYSVPMLDELANAANKDFFTKIAKQVMDDSFVPEDFARITHSHTEGEKQWLKFDDTIIGYSKMDMNYEGDGFAKNRFTIGFTFYPLIKCMPHLPDVII